MAHSDVLHIFERRRGPPNVAGPGVTHPLPSPLDGPGEHHDLPSTIWGGVPAETWI